MRVVSILKRTSYAFFLALLMLFALPLAMYGPAIAQGADGAEEMETPVAQLLLYPDPVVLIPGGTAVIDVRLHTSVPIYEAHITLTVQSSTVRFEDLFLGTGTSFYIFDRHIGAGEVSFVLQKPEGYLGNQVIGRVLLTADEAAEQGGVAMLGYGGSTTVLGPDLEHIALGMRPAEVRISDDPVIELTSTTHPDESSWYRRRSANVTWQTHADARYSYDISPLATDLPNDEPNEPVGAIEMRDLEDGIWYFALCELQEGECGEVTRRRYMIDATPPHDFSAEVKHREEGTYVEFAPRDGQSGILRTEIALDPEGVAPPGDRGAWIEAESPYKLPDGFSGDLLIRATDLAHNITIAGVTVSSGREGRTTAALMLIFSSAFAAYALWRYEQRNPGKASEPT